MLRNLLPQILIPILAIVFFVVFLSFPSFLFSFSCVVPCSHAAGNFGSIEKTWAIPYISKTHSFLVELMGIAPMS